MNNKVPNIKFTIVAVLLCIVVAFANLGDLKKLSKGEKIGLDNIPTQIGEWKLVSDQPSKNMLENWEFFNELLMRTYVNPQGDVIWLAISYGSDQRQAFVIHMPEGCYRAAGFDVESIGKVDIFENNIPLTRMISRGQGKTEPVSYWVMLDGLVVSSNMERKLKQLYYTLIEQPASGALIRVSSPASEKTIATAYKKQVEFLKEMAKSLPEELKPILFGNMLANAKF